VGGGRDALRQGQLRHAPAATVAVESDAVPCQRQRIQLSHVESIQVWCLAAERVGVCVCVCPLLCLRGLVAVDGGKAQGGRGLARGTRRFRASSAVYTSNGQEQKKGAVTIFALIQGGEDSLRGVSLLGVLYIEGQLSYAGPDYYLLLLLLITRRRLPATGALRAAVSSSLFSSPHSRPC
jgi:hypothetical protein